MLAFLAIVFCIILAGIIAIIVAITKEKKNASEDGRTIDIRK